MALSRNSENREKQLANLRPFTGADDPRRSKTGRPKKLPITDALRKLFDDPEFAAAYVRAATKHAKNGSGTHFKEINERVEGKIADELKIGGDDELIAALTGGRKRVSSDG